MPLLRSSDNKTTLLLRAPFASPKLVFSHIFIFVINTTPLLRQLLESPKAKVAG